MVQNPQNKTLNKSPTWESEKPVVGRHDPPKYAVSSPDPGSYWRKLSSAASASLSYPPEQAGMPCWIETSVLFLKDMSKLPPLVSAA